MYLTEAIFCIEETLGNPFAKKYTPIEDREHLYEDVLETLDGNDHNKYQMMIGICN